MPKLYYICAIQVISDRIFHIRNFILSPLSKATPRG